MTLLFVLFVQSTLLLSLGFGALFVTRRRGPAVQTLVGRATLSSIALLLLLSPLSGRVHSVWALPTPVRPSPTLPSCGILPQRREGEGVKRDVGALLAAPSVPTTSATGPAPSADAIAREGASRSAPTVSVPKPAVSRPNPSFRKDPAPEERGSKAVGLPSLLLLLWLAACQCQLVRLRRTAQAVADGPATALLATLTPNPPALLTHPSVTSPLLAGLRRPAIFLPPTYAADFDPDALRAIFVHELAHRDRRDNFWTLAARLLSALLWFQPLLWLLNRKLEHSSEDACDQAVLASNCPPRAYAACLLSLAERPRLAPSQRTLTAGVAPFRSSVGHRIQAILSETRYPVSAAPRMILGTVLCTLLCVPSAFLLLNVGLNAAPPTLPPNVVAHFTWAKQQKWAVRPIRVLDLDPLGLARAAELTYDITPRDKAELSTLTYRETQYSGSGGPPKSARVHLEAMLALRPRFFYTEYLLGSWYRQHGQTAHGAALQAQALRDAPVVLAGRYAYDDGTPVAGLRFATEIRCYDPAHLTASNKDFQNRNSQNGPVQLQYENIVTDAEGCYYLPIFRAVYSQQDTMWMPEQLNALTAPHLKAHADLVTPRPATSGTTESGDTTRLSKGFIAESRVAVLPQTQVRPQITLNAPFNAAEGSIAKPLLIPGKQLTVSWQPYLNAATYQVQIDEHHPSRDAQGKVTQNSDEWSQIWASAQNPARLGLPITQTKITLDFIGTDPVFSRAYPYTVTVLAMDRDGKTISQSGQFAFEPQNASAPEPLTPAAFAKAIGPRFKIISIKTQGKQITVNALVPANVPWSRDMDDSLRTVGRRFGMETSGWSSKTGVSIDTVSIPQPFQVVYNRR